MASHDEDASPQEWTDLGIVRAILDSHRERLGVELFERTGDTEHDAQLLRKLDAVVLSHDGGQDPVFVYANDAAAELWRLPIDALVGMPSRLSAPPERRGERASMLADAASAGFLVGYTGERITADGSRFMIEDATLWTVDGFPDRPGQAVVFRTWRPLAQPLIGVR
jgi:PAS domain-containing protein